MTDEQTPDVDGADVGLTEAEANRLRNTLVLSHPSAVWVNVRAAVVHIVAARVAAAVAAERKRTAEWVTATENFAQAWHDRSDSADRRAEAAERQVAAVRALADEWEGHSIAGGRVAANRLRAALDTAPTYETNAPDRGEGVAGEVGLREAVAATCGARHPRKHWLQCTLPPDHGPVKVGSLGFDHFDADKEQTWRLT